MKTFCYFMLLKKICLHTKIFTFKKINMKGFNLIAFNKTLLNSFP